MRPKPLTLNTLLVRGDGSALNADTVLLDGVRRVDGHLVVGGVAVWQAEVIVQALYVQVGEDELAKQRRQALL